MRTPTINPYATMDLLGVLCRGFSRLFTTVVICILISSHVESCNVDICVAIDRHPSVTSSNWTSMLEHVALFVEYFTIDTTTNRVGLVSFDEVSSLDIPLDKHSSTIPLQQDIRSQPYGGTGRDISNAILRIRLECFTEPNGDQPENINYAVIITNGESDATAAENAALLLRQAGAVVLAIGVGPDINHALLVSITAAGEKVYTVPSFDDLEENPTLLVETICPGTLNFPSIIGSPELSDPILQNSDFHFTCAITYDPEDVDGAHVQVEFMFDGLSSGLPITELTPPNNTVIFPSMNIPPVMGKTLSCQVRSYWSHSPTLLGPPIISRAYYVGYKLSKDEVIVSDKDESAAGGPPLIESIPVYSTIPIVCQEPLPAGEECHVELDILADKRLRVSQYSTVQSNRPTCILVLYNSDWQNDTVAPPTNVKRRLKIQSKRYSRPINRIEGDITIAVKQTQTTPQLHNMWQGQNTKSVKGIVRASAEKRGICSSVTDPHYSTFDKHTFTTHDHGIFLVLHNELDYTYIQAWQGACGPGSTRCGKNFGVAVKSGKRKTVGPYRREIQMMTRQEGKDPKVLKCQEGETYKVTANAERNTFIIRTRSEVKVTAKMNGIYMDLTIDVPAAFKGNNRTKGFCGVYNGIGGSDEYYPKNTSYDFIEYYRVENITSKNYFACDDLNKTTTVDEDAFCECNGDYLCSLGSDEKSAGFSSVRSQFPPDVVHTSRRKRDASPIYSDDIAHDYVPPVPVVEPVKDPTPPPWGSIHNITETAAQTHCSDVITSGPSYAYCETIVSSADLDLILLKCVRDIQILGDLSMASYHLSSYETLCKHEIQMSVTASDPEDPLADETYSNLLNGFLNTTCPNACSGQGVCVEGLCSCDAGWMGSDCSLDADTPPTPEYYESPDACDVTLQPCMSVTIHAKNLVTSDKLSCRVKIVMTDGSSQIFNYNGTRASTNAVRCPLPNLRTFGSSANPVAYNYSISLSNNAVIYKDMTSKPTRAVWFSEWMFWQCMGLLISKDVSCVIEATCHAAGEMTNSCYGCHPDKSQTSWTPKIDMEEDTNLSPWSAYDPCSKDCDYGIETRTRQCTADCCGWGSISQSQLCNDHNCQELEEEHYEGLKITITGLVMKQFVEQEAAMIGVITDLINSYTKQHPAEFCQALNLEPVTSTLINDILAQNDTTTSQGYPKSDVDDSVVTKMVTVVSESKTSGMCVPASSTRRRRTIQDDVLTLDGHYMADALVNIEASLEQLWSVDIDVTLDVPEIIPEKPNNKNETTTLILATVIPVIIIIIATAIAVPLVLKYKNRKNTETNLAKLDEKSSKSSAGDHNPYVNTVFPVDTEANERPSSAGRCSNRVTPSPCPPTDDGFLDK